MNIHAAFWDYYEDDVGDSNIFRVIYGRLLCR